MVVAMADAVPNMPPTADDAPTVPRKRGRKAKAPPVDSPAGGALAAPDRLKMAQEQGAQLAPYAITILQTAERLGKVQGVDDEKRAAAAGALAVAVCYTIPSLDPMYMVWLGAAASLAACYTDPAVKRLVDAKPPTLPPDAK